VTQKVDATGSLTVKGENIIGKSVIVIKPEDYKIEIPGVVRDKIAKEVKVDINLNLQEKK
jgi:flagellar basal body rod protein FlgF